ncbi:MAG: IS1634 family transposase [bacterium]
MEVYEDGPAPVIKAISDQIQFVQTINDAVQYDESQCKLSPGERVLAMVINALEDRKPLYHIEEYYEHKDVEKLFGEGISADDLNDDALGRALDKLAEAGGWEVYGDVVLEVIRREECPVRRLHGDTTSVSVQGDYEGPDDAELTITHGHSKDHRPDLKQFKYGVVVNEQGIPVDGTVNDGNQADGTWNRELIRSLRDRLNQPEKPLLYTADSKLVSETNLELLESKDMEFVSRLPGTFGLDEQLKQRAIREDDWEDVGAVAKRNQAAEYQVTSYEEPLYGQPYRFVVVQSTTASESNEETIQRELKQTKSELTEAIQTLQNREFACREDATRAMEEFKTTHSTPCFELNVRVIEDEKPIKRETRGRPPEGWEREYKTVYRCEGCVTQKDEAVQNRRAIKRCFVLITSVRSKQWLSDREVLEEYKQQNRVEVHFEFLKDPKQIGSVYLEKPHRVQALGYVLLMALLLYTIIQNRVRSALADADEPMQMDGGVTSFCPTGRRVLERLEPMRVVKTRGDPTRQFPGNLDVPYRVLELLGVQPDVYRNVDA